MADFKTHIGFSTLIGVAYGYAGYQSGLSWETCCIGAGLCSVSGMLPDLDSDSGIPLREATTFAAAIIPMLMVERLQRMGIRSETMILIAIGIYLFIRFGVAELFRNYTVHRGMWHSIPAAIAVGMVAFLICASEDISVRLFKTAAVVIGFVSHLLLDEIWSIEFRGARYQLKSSFGTAFKLWGQGRVANLVTYGLVIVLGVLVYHDDGFMQRFGYHEPEVPHTAQELLDRFLDRSREWLKR